MRQYKLEWSPDAVDDLDEIWFYIAADDIDAADNFITELRNKARDLCTNPKKGRIIPELEDESFRELYYKGYTIIYEIRIGSVLIHEVYHHSRIFIRTYDR